MSYEHLQRAIFHINTAHLNASDDFGYTALSMNVEGCHYPFLYFFVIVLYTYIGFYCNKGPNEKQLF